MPLLCLRLLSEAQPAADGYTLDCEWLVREDNGAVRGQGITDYQGLQDLADPDQVWVTDPRNVLVLVPNAHVLEVSATVPGRSVAQIRRALPFAVEEFVATDIDRMHVASASIRPGHDVACQLIERELLDSWLACIRSTGIQPGFFVTDAHLLPVAEGEVTALIEENSVLIHAPGQAATVDRDNLLMALQSLDASNVRLINGMLTDIEAAQLEDVQIEAAPGADSAIEVLADLWRGNADINLLQGDFAPPRARNASAKGWGLVATLAAVWIGVAWLAMAAEAFWADNKAQALEQEANTLYRNLFPGEKPPRNLRRTITAKLGQAPQGDGRGLVALTGDIAAVIPRTASMRSIEYSSDRGELKTELLVSGFSELEQLEAQLASRGVGAELQNSVQEDNGVRAYFVMRAE